MCSAGVLRQREGTGERERTVGAGGRGCLVSSLRSRSKESTREEKNVNGEGYVSCAVNCKKKYPEVRIFGRSLQLPHKLRHLHAYYHPVKHNNKQRKHILTEIASLIKMTKLMT